MSYYMVKVKLECFKVHSFWIYLFITKYVYQYGVGIREIAKKKMTVFIFHWNVDNSVLLDYNNNLTEQKKF